MLRIATKKLANTLLDTFYKNVGFKTMMKQSMNKLKCLGAANNRKRVENITIINLI